MEVVDSNSTIVVSGSSLPPQVESSCENQQLLLDLLLQLETCEDAEQLALMLVNQLRAQLPCTLVAYGSCRGSRRRVQLQAISGTPELDRRSELSRALESAMDETVLRDAVTVYPADVAGDRHSTRVHQRLCALTESQAVVSSHLKDTQNKTVGVWLFLVNDRSSACQTVAQFIRQSERQIGSCLRITGRATRGRLVSGLTTLQNAIRRPSGWSMLAAALVVLGLLAVPMDYQIRCDAELQPVLRRYVAAPFEARLESVEVAPGDVVSQGDILACIDGQEMRWQREELLAEYQRVSKQRDTALATHKIAETQLAALELERIQLQTDLLQHRINNLEIRSPLKGIVVSGDLKKVEGAPVEMGQSLFEIAPLDTMSVEVAVPEREVAHVAQQQTVELRLEAYPNQSWSAEIVRIHPRSELRDDQNVFVAELVLPNADGQLRPGMKGTAWIRGPRKRVAWNLFHRPWESFLMAMGW